MNKQIKTEKNGFKGARTGFSKSRDKIPGFSALERPQALKKWSGDLTEILEGEKDSLFNDFDFRPGDLTKVDFTRILRKMTSCGSLVELRSKLDRGTGEISEPAIHAANFCGQHTICPFCAARVQDRRKAKFKDAIKGAAMAFKHAYLVTATIPPIPTWREDLNALLDSWKAFRKMGQKRGSRKSGHSGGEWHKIKAGLSKVEIKRGKDSGLPHCHIHALFFTDETFDFRVWSQEEKQKDRADRKSLFENNASKISEEWTRATDGRATGLNIKKITGKAPKRAKGETVGDFEKRSDGWTYADSVFEQSREVLKYATKFEEAPESTTEAKRLFASDFVGIRSATYGRRLFQTYGEFRKIGGDDYKGSEHPISSNPIIYAARWNADRYRKPEIQTRSNFPDAEPGPGGTVRRQTLGRVLGETRRIRRAINDAKRLFFADGLLGPALMNERKWDGDGGFIDTPKVLELPASVIADPTNPETWEAWVDAATLDGHSKYRETRAELDLDSHERLIGTIQERADQDEFERAIYRSSQQYRDDAAELFIETINASQCWPVRPAPMAAPN